MSTKGKPWKARRTYTGYSTPATSWPPIADERDVTLQCAKKKAYNNPVLAREVARRAPHVEGMAVRAYTCPHCSFIHVGHYEERA